MGRLGKCVVVVGSRLRENVVVRSRSKRVCYWCCRSKDCDVGFIDCEGTLMVL